MRTYIAFLSMLLAASASCAAEDAASDAPKSIEELCAKEKCQHDLHVNLHQRDGKSYEHTFDIFPPVIQPIGIVIVAGQTVQVEADVEDGKLVNLVAVDKIEHPERTISATLTQEKNGGMALSVKNPFERHLKFNMGFMPLEKEVLLKTTSCPVVAHGFSRESWPFPIFQLVLANGQLLSESDKFACVD